MDRVDTAFINLMCYFVPPSKQHELEQIINANVSTIKKTNQIRDKIIEYINLNVPGIKFKSVSILHKWYVCQCASYIEMKTLK